MENNLESETPNAPEIPPFDPKDVANQDKVSEYVKTHIRKSHKSYADQRARAGQADLSDEEYAVYALKITQETIIELILFLSSPEREHLKGKKITPEKIAEILKSHVAVYMQPPEIE